MLQSVQGKYKRQLIRNVKVRAGIIYTSLKTHSAYSSGFERIFLAPKSHGDYSQKDRVPCPAVLISVVRDVASTELNVYCCILPRLRRPFAVSTGLDKGSCPSRWSDDREMSPR